MVVCRNSTNNHRNMVDDPSSTSLHGNLKLLLFKSIVQDSSDPSESTFTHSLPILLHILPSFCSVSNNDSFDCLEIYISWMIIMMWIHVIYLFSYIDIRSIEDDQVR